ncbi:hypothetical protein [Nocardioides sp. WS12]|uniref:hypothetical protein n=1 Tax=Nocardioides sp. WS12 TaxID=2486272 RepID=UPI0015FD607E|nr:hypothetical protein [Nocardioides sp. WS12]
MRTPLSACVALLLAVALSGCSGDGDDDSKASSTTSFCDALAEVDAAIDGAKPDDEDSWKRIVTAFDTLDEVGVPDNLPAPGPAELEHVEGLVRKSDSVEAFQTAVEADPPTSDAVGEYISDHCR